jgi:hypothetical protein
MSERNGTVTAPAGEGSSVLTAFTDLKAKLQVERQMHLDAIEQIDKVLGPPPEAIGTIPALQHRPISEAGRPGRIATNGVHRAKPGLRAKVVPAAAAGDMEVSLGDAIQMLLKENPDLRSSAIQEGAGRLLKKPVTTKQIQNTLYHMKKKKILVTKGDRGSHTYRLGPKSDL